MSLSLKAREARTVQTQLICAKLLQIGDIIVEFGEGKRIDRRTYVKSVNIGECMHHVHVNKDSCYDAAYPLWIVKRK